MHTRERFWSKITHSRLLALIGAVVLIGAFGVVLSPALRAKAATYTGISSTDFYALEAEIQNLNARISTLETRITTLQTQLNTQQYPSYQYPSYQYPTYPTTPTYPVTNYGPVSIDQNGGRFTAGWDIYFTGRGFAPSETVMITTDGGLVRQVRADAAGNISSGGVPLALGYRTYQFRGQTSGVTAMATVQGVRDVTNPYP